MLFSQGESSPIEQQELEEGISDLFDMFIMYSFDLIKSLTGMDYIEAEASTLTDLEGTYSDDRDPEETNKPLVIDEVSEDKEYSMKNSQRLSIKSLQSIEGFNPSESFVTGGKKKAQKPAAIKEQPSIQAKNRS